MGTFTQDFYFALSSITKMSLSHVIAVCVLCVYLCQAAITDLSDDDIAAILKKHNDARKAEHANLPMLTWNVSLAKEAQSWTDNCEYHHQSGSPWGENLAASTRSGSNALASALVDLWTNEKKNNVNG